MLIQVELSDLEKINDAVVSAMEFFKARDEMNAKLHLAANVRYSPLASEVEAAGARLGTILADAEPSGGTN